MNSKTQQAGNKLIICTDINDEAILVNIDKIQIVTK